MTGEVLNQPEVPTANSSSVDGAASASEMPLPYPGFEDLPKGEYDSRALSKFIANTYTMILNETPNHPKREEIHQYIARERQIAEMDDKQFLSHQMYEANPIHKLTQEEKLHCIRTLPIPIARKLFPHL